MVKPLLISSTRKSSGKTIISIGLSGLANNLGYDIQTFKKGPDFIDPSWLTLASRRPCYNLDFNKSANSALLSPPSVDIPSNNPFVPSIRLKSMP